MIQRKNKRRLSDPIVRVEATKSMTPCHECGAYHSHSPECSIIDFETAKKQLAQYVAAWRKLELERRAFESGVMLRASRYRQETTYWQGKFNILKHENNSLRRKLYSQNGKVKC